jgi:putative protease
LARINLKFILKHMKTSHIELMAPAGSFDSLQAAINAKADSVYLGVSEFNMRASAAVNFTHDDLEEIVQRCHDNGLKVHVTVNTLLYNDELDKMRRTVDLVKKHGVDAVIGADMATIQYCKKLGIETHISTQLSISNTESLKFYSQFADRVVLARELSLEQVKEICRDVKNQEIKGPSGELVQIEVFAHGALCVAVSGRCAMSLFSYGTSANRGKCAQVCRRRFKVRDIDTDQELEIDNNYVMSPKDLSTIGMLPELVDAGVNVLKLEGRGRPPEYVQTVVTTYREALSAIENNEYTVDKIKEWNKHLGTVYNRGMSTGLYMGRKFDEWSGAYGSVATEEKTLIGEVDRYYPKIKVAQLVISAKETIKEGEKYLITGPKTGALQGVIKGMRVDEKEVKQAKKGDEITFKVPKRVREGDKFFVVRKRESKIPKGKERFFK